MEGDNVEEEEGWFTYCEPNTEKVVIVCGFYWYTKLVLHQDTDLKHLMPFFTL